MTNLTVSYFTSRKNPCIQWFLDSLWNQQQTRTEPEPRIVVVDFWLEPHKDYYWTEGDVAARKAAFRDLCRFKQYLHVPPKPNVWAGPARLTNEDYFAMASARNTAICHAVDGWIAFVDDLSVLKPGWLAGCHRAMAHGHAICVGGYRKVRELVVEDGVIISCIEDPKAGVDNRYATAGKDEPVVCPGHWLYGYSVSPVEAWLSINGWDERADGLSFEDVPTGIALEKKGWSCRYDRTMMAYESEELHGQPGATMRRADYGKPPNDKSHAILKLAQEGDGWVPNDFSGKTLKELRDEILCGAQFPIPRLPNREWFSGVALTDIRYGEYPDSLYR